MKVLVTGGTGFVGSHAAVALIAAGHDVRLLARTPAKVPAVFAPHGLTIDDVVAGDMCDPAAVAAAVAGCAAIVHCAAEIGVSGGSGPTGSPVNAKGTEIIVDAGLAAGVESIVYISSMAAHLPTDVDVITNSTPFSEPLSAYGESKRDADLFVQEHQRAGAPISTLVLGAVYGPLCPHLDGGIAALTGALGMMMLVPPGGMGIIDVRDIATLIVRLLDAEPQPRRLIAGGRYVTWQQWTDLVSEAAGVAVVQQTVTEAELTAMGRDFDLMRAQGLDAPPLSVEGAILMLAGKPSDDSETLAILGADYRPILDTFRDTVDWLRSINAVPSP